MNRIFVPALAVPCAFVARMLFLPEDSVLGPLLTYGAVLAFFGWCALFLNSDKLFEMARVYAYSDPNGPNQGFDPRTVEAGKRRAEGIE